MGSTPNAVQIVLESMERHLAHCQRKPLVKRIVPRPHEGTPSQIVNMTAAAQAWAAGCDQEELNFWNDRIADQISRRNVARMTGEAPAW